MAIHAVATRIARTPSASRRSQFGRSLLRNITLTLTASDGTGAPAAPLDETRYSRVGSAEAGRGATTAPGGAARWPGCSRTRREEAVMALPDSSSANTWGG